MGIWETLRRTQAKLAMRASGYQAKTACGNLKLCAGLEASIEGFTQAVGQRRLERVREQRGEEDETEESEEEEEEGGGWIAACLNNINKETAGTEEEAAEGLEAALGRTSQDMEVEEERGSEG